MTVKEVLVPDIGAFSNVDVIEVLVKPGDIIEAETAMITLETDKATMEIPAPFGGKVQDIKVAAGDKVSKGSVILTLEAAEAESTPKPAEKTEISKVPLKPAEPEIPKVPEPVVQKTTEAPKASPVLEQVGAEVHAGPGVRRFARELGVMLTRVQGSGLKNRILKTDVQAYVKSQLTANQSGSGGAGLHLAPLPQVDFSQFGEIELKPLSRIKKLSGSYLHRNWVMVPHITQFDEADITEMEQFRKENQPLAEQQGIKLTPIVFLMKAVVAALKEYPHFNASLDNGSEGSQLVLKKYFHIAVAVDTPNGLVVPVIRDVDRKGLFQLAKELGEISTRARAGQLKAEEMQGSCFTISSLGGIGGTAFTPIVNVPDVAILGVSKAAIKPVYLDGEFRPRLLLPLSLSYDHRVIDGAEGARFSTFLVKQLSDIRRLLF